MDPKELIARLGLAAEPPAAAAGPDRAGPAAGADRRPAGTTPTAIEVDEWGLRRGRDLAAAGPVFAGDEAAAADFFAAAFDPDPRPTGTCADALRGRFVDSLLGTPEYAALHTDTALNDCAAEIAASHFAAQFARLKADAEKKPEADAAGPAADAGLAADLAACRAAAAAAAEVGEMAAAAAALGMGDGAPGAGTDPAAMAAMFNRVRTDPTLRRICDLAGRFRMVARSRQRTKTVHGVDDVVGVEMGGDVGRLLPTELARLAAPELELDAVRRVLERQAACREHAATEPVGKGPVIVSVDESGSMRGRPIEAAKALALGLAWVAGRQRRWVGLVAYSGDSGERLLTLPPGRWDDAALCDWLTAFIGRGSTIDIPVREMPRMYAAMGAPAGVTDLVFVTDAVCTLPPAVRDPFLAWKAAAKARLVTLVVGSDRPGDLALISDEVHAVPAIDPAADAVGRILSL